MGSRPTASGNRLRAIDQTLHVNVSRAKFPSLVNSLLERFLGLTVSRAQSRTPRSLLDDPRLFDYLEIGGGGATFLAPLGHVSCFQFQLGPDSIHPWVVAVRRGLKSGQRSDVSDVLEAYYSLVAPKDAAEWLDVPGEEVPELQTREPHGASLPWSVLDPTREEQRQVEIHLRENREYGLVEGISSGAKAYGPMTDARREMETERLWQLAQSVSRKGLDTARRDYALSGDFLIDGDQFFILVRGGGHRASVASALGIERIPLQISTLVRKNEVSIWPQVVSGLYREETALRVFDRLLAGRPPGIADRWIAFVG